MESLIMSYGIEKTNLEAHVDLCAERYRVLENRLTKVETKLEKIDTDVSDIKVMLKTSQAKQTHILLGISGAIITVLIAIVGYLFTRLV
jgi:hypothetical protein